MADEDNTKENELKMILQIRSLLGKKVVKLINNVTTSLVQLVLVKQQSAISLLMN